MLIPVPTQPPVQIRIEKVIKIFLLVCLVDLNCCLWGTNKKERYFKVRLQKKEVPGKNESLKITRTLNFSSENNHHVSTLILKV